MNLLLLGGNSPHNKNWIYRVAEELSPLFDRCIVHEYAHWETGEQFIDFDAELATLQTELEAGTDYIVFAKSVGTVLAAKGTATGTISPQGCLFTGVPLGLIVRHGYGFAEWLKAAHLPLLLVQNSDDPAGSSTELQEYLQVHGLPPTMVHELPGDTHDYNDLPELRRLTAAWLAMIRTAKPE